MKKKKRSLQSKLFLVLTSSTIIIILLIILVNSFIYKPFYIFSKQVSLARICRQINKFDFNNDFEKSTKIARAMVTEYGMSDLGPVQFEHQESSVFLGRDYNKSRNFSSQVAFEIDQEIRKIINERYEYTKKIIEENRDLLDLIANTLLEYETITKEQIDYLVSHGCMPDEDSENTLEDIKELSYEDLTLVELKELAKERGIKNYSKMTKEEIIGELSK